MISPEEFAIPKFRAFPGKNFSISTTLISKVFALVTVLSVLLLSTKMTSKSLAKKVGEHFDFCLFTNDLSFIPSKRNNGNDIHKHFNEYLIFLEKRKEKLSFVCLME